jgi:hypothetical protein
MRRPAWRPRLVVVVAMLGAVVVGAAPCHAQHGNYLLGTLGLLGGAQAPEGIYYQNVFTYYHASGFRAVSAIDARSVEILRQQLQLSATANLNVKSSLDAYIDQNIIGVTTPFKILGASYGLMIDILFVGVDATGNASLPDPSGAAGCGYPRGRQLREWGLGKTFRPASWAPAVAQIDTGVVGYAQWQVTDNRGGDIPPPLQGLRSDIFGVRGAARSSSRPVEAS